MYVVDESLSTENQILLCCARRNVDFDVLGALVDRSVNWDALLDAAQLHHLLPLLYERLKGLDGSRVPPAVMARLRSAYYTNLLRNRQLHAELTEVVSALRREGVETIVLKGGALAWTVYAHSALRPMSDLDLLIRPEAMERTVIVLESLGFCLSDAIPAHLVPFEQRFGGGLEWQRSHGNRTTRLDVHQRPVGIDWCQTAFPIETDVLWGVARPLALDGTEALQLSAEDTVIHLCLHLALQHGYACPLMGYTDLDRVITAEDQAFSWPRLIERAERFGTKTVVYRGLRCAKRLLGTPVPPGVLVALEPSDLSRHILRRLAPLSGEAVLQVANRRQLGIRRILLQAALADRHRSVGIVVWSLLFPGEERLAVRYALQTRRRARLYFLIHPWLLAWAALRSLQQPLTKSTRG
jgi:hypothetical protein